VDELAEFVEAHPTGTEPEYEEHAFDEIGFA
jgi:hypothetical protein